MKRPSKEPSSSTSKRSKPSQGNQLKVPTSAPTSGQASVPIPENSQLKATEDELLETIKSHCAILLATASTINRQAEQEEATEEEEPQESQYQDEPTTSEVSIPPRVLEAIRMIQTLDPAKIGEFRARLTEPIRCGSSGKSPPLSAWASRNQLNTISSC